MEATLNHAPYDQPTSIATKADVESAVNSSQQALQTQIDAIGDTIPATICRTSATTGVQPTAIELKNIAPDDPDITSVILSDGKTEIWQFSGGSWSLKLTIDPAQGSAGSGSFACSTNAEKITTLVGATQAGQQSSCQFFADVGRDVTVSEDRAAHLTTCARECEIVHDLSDNTWWIVDSGAYTTYPEPVVARFFGTISARRFARLYEANGGTYCNNYHQCYEKGPICRPICVFTAFTGQANIRAVIDNGSAYTVKYGGQEIQTPSGDVTTLNLTDFSGKIEVCAEPDSDDFDLFETDLPMPDSFAGCS